jgi:hypothetical protein
MAKDQTKKQMKKDVNNILITSAVPDDVPLLKLCNRLGEILGMAPKDALRWWVKHNGETAMRNAQKIKRLLAAG